MNWKILLYAVIGYIALNLIIFFSQRKLLYLPSKIEPSEQQALDKGLRYWPSYENYRGFLSKGAQVDSEGTIVIFHGNAGEASHRTYYVKALSRQGFRVIVVEYPGYGGRLGKPSENAFVEDAKETLRLAYQEFGSPLFLWGESLGSGVVAAVATKTEIPIKALVLLTPWDSLSNLAQTHYWYLPARWLVLDKFNSVANLQSFEGKVAVLLAERDEVIPIRHGKNLYNSINASKKLWLFDNAGHNSWPVDPEAPWWHEVTKFISQ